MTSDRLTQLAAQYRAAKRRHQTALRAVAGALADMRRIQPELAAEIVAEAKRGARPKELIEVTGYTAERVRQILRAGKVPPADSNNPEGDQPVFAPNGPWRHDMPAPNGPWVGEVERDRTEEIRRRLRSEGVDPDTLTDDECRNYFAD